MNPIQVLTSTLVIFLLTSDHAKAQGAANGEPITFMGIHAFMSEDEIKSALTTRGYECSAQKNALGNPTDKSICQKRVGDNFYVPGAGAFAKIEIRPKCKGKIQIDCLAILDGLGRKGEVTCSPLLEHSTKNIGQSLTKMGVIKREHKLERTGQREACITSRKGDKMCIAYSDYHRATMITMYPNG